MENNQSLEIVEKFCALARNFVCDPSRIIDTQAGFLIHSLHARNFFFKSSPLQCRLFSQSIAFLIAFLVTLYSCNQAFCLHLDIHIANHHKWWCLDPPLRNPEQTLPGTIHIMDPGRPSAIFSTPLRPTAITALLCLPCLFRLVSWVTRVTSDESRI